jgi:hypothetical protein
MSLRPAVRIVFAPVAPRDKPTRTVLLDPRRSNMAKALHYELLRVAHPSWSKRALRTTVEYRWRRMSWRGKARLYQMLGSAQLEGEE